MEALVLVGGLGQRLRSVIDQVPKPMAPIHNRPFLEYVLDYLKNQSINKVILCTGYKGEVITNHFGDNYKGIEIVYSHEEEPLGTGGAIKKGLQLVEGKNAIVLNGDSIFTVNLYEMIRVHKLSESDLTLYIKPKPLFGEERYHVVRLHNQNRIVDFKKPCGFQNAEMNYINGGLYIINVDLFNLFNLPYFFSFENEFITNFVNSVRMYGYISDGYFIDIGVPEDYKRAKNKLLQINN